MSVCLSARMSQNRESKLREIFCTCYPWPWLGPFSGDNAIRYVLPVLLMTSYFHTMSDMAHGIGSNDVGAGLQQEGKISNVFARGRHAV